MDNIIKERILDFHQSGISEFIRRDIAVNHVKDMVTTIVGGRKTGKTYLTYQIIDDLIRGKTIKSLKQVCYLHFDDEALAALKAEELSRIDRIFLSLLDGDGEKENLLFVFDEIHNVPGWENFVLRLKKRSNWIVVVTGSTAELEEDKVAKQLRGKTFTNRIYPLSFKEFLRFNGSCLDLGGMSSTDKAEVMNRFGNYMEKGCYPAAATLDPSLIRQLLQNYFNSIVVSDFILNKNIQNPAACKAYLRNLLQKNACPYTHKKELNNLKSIGFNLAPKTISDWFSLSEDVYFIGNVGINTNSLKRMSQNYRKIYCCDWAMSNAVTGWSERRTSRTLETIVFWHLIREGFKVAYDIVGQEKYEVDFIVSSPGEKSSFAIQVCSDVSDETTMTRETRSLRLLCKHNLGIKPIILTQFEPTKKSDIPVFTILDLLSGELLNRGSGNCHRLAR
jgi:hypothetical protein